MSDTVYEPFHCWSSDWLGPFTADDHGNTYLHVIIDAASRKILLHPHPAQKAQYAAEDFLKVFGQFAIPEQIHSDNGSVYTAHLIEEFCNLLDLKHTTITPYRHESNGQVEVFNREILKHLKAIVLSRDIARRWSFHAIPIVESIMNNVANTVTGITPNQYLHGVIFDAHRGLNSPFAGKRPITKYLQDLWDLQPLLIQASQAHQAEQSDARHAAGLRRVIDDFEPGSYVVVTYPDRSPTKLSSKYRGPFLVKQRVTEGKKKTDTYIVEDITSGTPLTFHASRLRPFYHPADPKQLTPFDVAACDKDEYAIDYISGHADDIKRKTSLDFKVHWFG